jgi:hypothetical protein
MVGNVAQGQSFLRVLPLLPVTIIPPLPHTNFYLNSVLIRWTIKEIPGTFKISNASPDITAALRSKFLSHCLDLKGLNKHPGN